MVWYVHEMIVTCPIALFTYKRTFFIATVSWTIWAIITTPRKWFLIEYEQILSPKKDAKKEGNRDDLADKHFI